VLWAGQTDGGVNAVVPVRTIMNQLIAEAEAALSRGADLCERISERANSNFATTM